MTSCGDTGKNGLDKQSNKDKDWLCSAHGPRGISGLLPGNKFLWLKECSCCKFNCCARIIDFIILGSNGESSALWFIAGN